jgi:hypothetical protein
MNAYPKDLAKAVLSALREIGSEPLPPLARLTELFEMMYFASLKTEESQAITLHIVYVDPNKPDPNPPRRIRNDRWNYIPLAEFVPITIPNLVKIAKASDPRTSSFAVYHNTNQQLHIHGLVDQGNSYYDFNNHNTESGHARPGLFQASILGVGHIVASIDYEKIAELKVNNLRGSSNDVLYAGPVNEALWPGIENYVEGVAQLIPDDCTEDISNWIGSLAALWINSLCRLILRAQNYRHGGAFLLTPDSSLQDLNPKYQIQYNRLRNALEKQGALKIQDSYVSDLIWEEFIKQDADEIPTEMYLDESSYLDDLNDNRNELDGAIWFVSLLTRVDGLVLMNQNLEVKGFGVEITSSKEPSEVFLAQDHKAISKKLRKIDYNHYGTRHRSMMRYCSRHEGSIGIVISQDGDVRVFTRVNDKLIMWENIGLQLDDTRKVKRRKKPNVEMAQENT